TTAPPRTHPLSLHDALPISIAGAVFAGMVPALAALALWKDRGLGHIPLLSHSARAPGGLAAAHPLAALNLHKYTHEVDWSRFLRSEEHMSELQSQSNLVCRL